MKKILIIAVVLMSLSANAQKKDSTLAKDSLVVITIATKQEYFNLLNFIASKIDSKKETEELIKYFEDRRKLVAIKPKQ